MTESTPNRIRNFENTATESDVVAGNYIPLDCNVTKKLEVPTLLKVTAQNALAGNVVPEFDPTKPNDAGGYAYYKDEIVSNGGATYRFKVNHSSGAWNAAEVERYVAGESLKFFIVSDNPEYLYAITDKDGIFLFGIKKDGSVDWQKGIPEHIKKFVEVTLSAALSTKVDVVEGKTLIDSVFASGISYITSEEYAFAALDNDGRFLFGIKSDGSVDWQKGTPKCLELESFVKKINGKGLVDSLFGDSSSSISSDEFCDLECDSENRVISAVRRDGSVLHETRHDFNGGLGLGEKSKEDIARAIGDRILSIGNWSDKKSLQIPQPEIAVVNFSGFPSMPTTKTADYKGYVEFFDLSGNYFKKRAIVNAQGNSSLGYPKKNFSIDLVNDEWVGDDSFKLKIGEWVAQDSFHIKAFATDFFRGVAKIGYDWYDQIEKTRGVINDATWKMALNDTRVVTDGKGTGYDADGDIDSRMDFGARCHPLGFPVILLFNGEFYGVYQFMLKKHRDNYHMSKSKAKHVHLDGVLNSTTFFGGEIDWTQFEVRNPKSLITEDGSNYDGDDPSELIDSDSPSYNPGNSKHVLTATVKEEIVDFANFVASLADKEEELGINSDEFKAYFESVLNVDNIIDYVIFSELTGNYDGFSKNWQWTTWDGERWYVNAYDLDGIFGSWSTGRFVVTHTYTHGIISSNVVAKYVYSVDSYKERMKARYASLKTSGVVDSGRVCRMLNDMVALVGTKNYEDDHEKWPSNCNSSSVVDEHWELVLDGSGNPVFGDSSTYSDSTSYAVGDECFYGQNSIMGYYKFKCVATTTGNEPFSSIAFADSIWRICKWIEIQFDYVDGLMS